MAVNLKLIRKRRGLTQEQLAELVGVTNATVQRHETRKREMNLSDIEKYAEALNCRPADIIDENALEEDKEMMEVFTKLPEDTKKQFIKFMQTL